MRSLASLACPLLAETINEEEITSVLLEAAVSGDKEGGKETSQAISDGTIGVSGGKSMSIISSQAVAAG